MDKNDFEKLVLEALEALPEKFQKKLENVAIVVEEGMPPNQDLLGLYHGIPHTRRGPGYTMVLPDKITIWKGMIEAIARDEKEIPALVRRVVWHEIGHHFGFDEKEIRKLEKKWEREGKI
jgi:predicted Zn-dependent protease with MMP-like domain